MKQTTKCAPRTSMGNAEKATPGAFSRFAKNFKKNLPITLMALPALVVMFLFRYLSMAGLMLAFKRFSVPKGIFGSDWIGFKNFEFLFKTSDAWVITRNPLCYNALFIFLDVVLAVSMAIGLSELLRKRRAGVYSQGMPVYAGSPKYQK